MEKLEPIHPYRKNIYEKFKCLLNENNIENNTENDIKKIALNIERGIFNHCLTLYKRQAPNEYWNHIFENIYINRSVHLYNNLNPNGTANNPNLLSRLLQKEFNEFEFANLTSDKLNPERYNTNMKNYLDSLPKVAEPTKLEDLPDGAFKCKCKSWKTSYTEVQTRSAKIIGWKSTLLITSWLCYLKNSCRPSLILKC